MTKLFLKKILKYVFTYTALFFVIVFFGTLIILLLKGFKSFNKKVIIINIIPLTIIIITFLLNRKIENEGDTTHQAKPKKKGSKVRTLR